MTNIIKAWWDRNSKKNNHPKTILDKIDPIKCSECGQTKGWKGVAVKPEYINLGKITGTYYES